MSTIMKILYPYYLVILHIILYYEITYLNASPLIGKNVRPAEEDEFPFIVSIGYRDYFGCNENHFCGGSLITKKHILTAAHCIANETVDNLEITVNSIDLRDVYKHIVRSMMTYSQWATSKHMDKDTSDDDVAILTLFFNMNGIPLPSLSEIDDQSYYGKNVVTAGWGLHRTGYLQTADLKVIDRETCKEYVKTLPGIKKENIIPPQWLCASSSPRTILGNGDSGGPLLYEKNTIIGVNAALCPKTNNTNDVCFQNVFVSISYVKDFIDDVTINGYEIL